MITLNHVMVKMAASATGDKFSKEGAISLTNDLLKQCEAAQKEDQGIVHKYISIISTSKKFTIKISVNF